MSDPAPINQRKEISLPAIPALHLDAKNAYILTNEGEIQSISYAQARQDLQQKTHHGLPRAILPVKIRLRNILCL